MAMIAVVLPLSGMVISFSSDDNDISEMEGVAAAAVVVEAAGSAALALGPAVNEGMGEKDSEDSRRS